MTIGMCMEYIAEYLNTQKSTKNEESKVRQATQADFDRF